VRRHLCQRQEEESVPAHQTGSARPLAVDAWRTADRYLQVIGAVAGYVSETLGLLGLGVGIVLQLWNLIFRNIGLLSVVPGWVSDASTLALVSGALLYAASTRTHLGFEGVARVMGRTKVQDRLDFATMPVVTAFLAILAYAGFQYVSETKQIGGVYSTAFWSPLWQFYLLFPVTFLLTALRWLGRRDRGGAQTIADERAIDIRRVEEEQVAAAASENERPR
jgi:TRAP-type C4-dicarboxylate transport system permease small subunit